LAIEGEPGAGAALTLGTGDVTVDSNLIQGNFAEAGNGGGIRLQSINGNDVTRNPGRPGNWWRVTLTNNIIVNNVAGSAGGGISLADALNTIWCTTPSPPTTAPGSPTVVQHSRGCDNHWPDNCRTQRCRNQFGTDKPAPGSSGSAPGRHLEAESGQRHRLHNRSFFFDSSAGTPQMCSSNSWTDAAAHTCRTLVAQATTGECAVTSAGPGAAYWDLGVVGDQSATPGILALNPTYSVLTSSPATRARATPPQTLC